MIPTSVALWLHWLTIRPFLGRSFSSEVHHDMREQVARGATAQEEIEIAQVVGQAYVGVVLGLLFCVALVGLFFHPPDSVMDPLLTGWVCLVAPGAAGWLFSFARMTRLWRVRSDPVSRPPFSQHWALFPVQSVLLVMGVCTALFG